MVPIGIMTDKIEYKNKCDINIVIVLVIEY